MPAGGGLGSHNFEDGSVAGLECKRADLRSDNAQPTGFGVPAPAPAHPTPQLVGWELVSPWHAGGHGGAEQVGNALPVSQPDSLARFNHHSLPWLRTVNSPFGKHG